MVLAFTKLSFNFCHSKIFRDNEPWRKVQKTERKLQTYQAYQIYKFHHYQSSRWTHDGIVIGWNIKRIYSGLHRFIFIPPWHCLSCWHGRCLCFILLAMLWWNIFHIRPNLLEVIESCYTYSAKCLWGKMPTFNKWGFFSIMCQVFQGKISTGQNVIVQKPTKYVCNLNQYTYFEAVNLEYHIFHLNFHWDPLWLQ